MKGYLVQYRRAANALRDASIRSEGMLMVASPGEDGIDVVYAFRTGAGPVVREAQGMDRDELVCMVEQTIGRGGIPWIVLAPGLPQDLEAAIRDLGVDDDLPVGGEEDSPPPDRDGIEKAFSRALPVTGGERMSFCRHELVEDAQPVHPGDMLRMRVDIEGGSSVVRYLASSGRCVGLHGVLPRILSPREIAQVDAVEAPVKNVSLGQTGETGSGNLHQIVLFDIPARVDAILQGAKIPRTERNTVGEEEVR